MGERTYDSETGLYNYKARYYSPEMGRFISEDPIDFAGGDVNLYAYVGNNPVNFTDPLGMAVYYCYGKAEDGNYDHARVCVDEECAGLYPLNDDFFDFSPESGLIIREKFNPDQCREMDLKGQCDQKEYEECVRNKMPKPREYHYYGAIFYNCISWARSVILECQKKACN